MRHALPVLLATALLATPALAQRRAAEPPAPAGIAQAVTASAIVESLDQTTRQAVLRGPNGDLRTVVVGPEVRNLNQVRAGDTVTLVLGQAIMLAVAQANDGAAPLAALDAAGRALPGNRPGAGAMQAVRARVTVNAVDARSGSVTFTGPLGVQRTARPRSPELAAFIRRLTPGQQVDVAYAEGVSLRVEPMARR